MGNVVNSIHISRFSRWTGITGSIRTPRIQSRALPDSFTAKIDGDDRETQTPRNRCLWYQVLGRRIWGSRDSREGDRIEKHRGREERRWKLRRFNFRIQFMSVYYSCTPQHLYARSTHAHATLVIASCLTSSPISAHDSGVGPAWPGSLTWPNSSILRLCRVSSTADTLVTVNIICFLGNFRISTLVPCSLYSK
jgi:hypothetical protein